MGRLGGPFCNTLRVRFVAVTISVTDFFVVSSSARCLFFINILHDFGVVTDSVFLIVTDFVFRYKSTVWGLDL